jgi:hypothetical protein
LMAKLFLSFMVLTLFITNRVSSRLGSEFTMILCPRWTLNVFLRGFGFNQRHYSNFKCFVSNWIN